MWGKQCILSRPLFLILTNKRPLCASPEPGDRGVGIPWKEQWLGAAWSLCAGHVRGASAVPCGTPVLVFVRRERKSSSCLCHTEVARGLRDSACKDRLRAPDKG